jgi:hypothetical protein
MVKAARPAVSHNTIELAKEELRCYRRGDDFTCAIARSHGKNFVLVHSEAHTVGRGRMYAIDESGTVYPTLLLDGLYSVRDERDTYHVERRDCEADLK